MVESIKLSLDESDRQIEIRTFQLSREEINNLSKVLLELSW